MITRLELLLKSDTKIKPSDGSLLQGFLMNLLDKDYVEYLHSNALNPYSQYVYYDKDKDCYIWRISTLTEEAKKYIITPILETDIKNIKINNNNSEYKVLSKGITIETDYQKISDKFFLSDNTSRYINIKTLTPVTYKSNGSYQNFPDVKSLYISLYNKWNLFNSGLSLDSENVLEHLIEHTILDSYKLHSTNYYTDGTKIKSFSGEMTYYIKGPAPLVNIANMLYNFAQYSGFGAKTGMGMGGINIE